MKKEWLRSDTTIPHVADAHGHLVAGVHRRDQCRQKQQILLELHVLLSVNVNRPGNWKLIT